MLNRAREVDAEKVELRGVTELLAAFLVGAETGKTLLESLVELLSPDVSPWPPSCNVHFRAIEKAGGEVNGCKLVHEVI